LRRDPDLARRMGEAGLARARAAFTWKGVGESLAQIYARAAGLAPATGDSERIALPKRAAAGAAFR
ncbi:glycosyltransferase, partial [Salmonella enterica]